MLYGPRNLIGAIRFWRGSTVPFSLFVSREVGRVIVIPDVGYDIPYHCLFRVLSRSFPLKVTAKHTIFAGLAVEFDFARCPLVFRLDDMGGGRIHFVRDPSDLDFVRDALLQDGRFVERVVAL